jgi:hypothetical protein
VNIIFNRKQRKDIFTPGISAEITEIIITALKAPWLKISDLWSKNKN